MFNEKSKALETIRSMKCLCCLCHDLREKVLLVLEDDGLDAALDYAANYDGMQCAAVERIMRLARDATNWWSK